MGKRLFFVLLLFLIVFPGSALCRELHWDDFTVDAYLSEDGTLQVKEQQGMIFSGDWNGGERFFSLRPGQKFVFEGLYKKDADGSLQKLANGSLKKLDNWSWSSSSTLRWRSRLPSDPPFSNTKITYLLQYRLGKILAPSPDGGFMLNHNFAFSKRSGDINNFVLRLRFAPQWQLGEEPLIFEQKLIPPGKSFVLRKQLQHTNPEMVKIYKKPAVPVKRVNPSVAPAPLWLAISALCAAVGFLFFLIFRFYIGEIKAKRFRRGLEPGVIDQKWLDKHVFNFLPETVGATWDKKTSGHEVAAILARMVVEKKLSSRIEGKTLPIFGWKIPALAILHLTMLQPRNTFTGYEKALIDGFFIDGDTTDTKKIRQYYREKPKTFLPVSKISAPLKRKVDELTVNAKRTGQYNWLYIVVIGCLAFFTLLAQFFLHRGEAVITIPSAFYGLTALIVGGANGYNYSCKADSLKTNSLFVHLFPLLTVLAYGAVAYYGISSLLTVGLLFLSITIIATSYYAAACIDSERGVTLRRNLADARAYFKEQLKKQNPQIKDSWYPYLLAFGLGSDVDKWTKSFGDVAYRTYNRSSSTVNSSSGAGYSFSGGGGSFGGAGSSGSWAMAAASLGRSSSSSSSSSGGGGGSSGGGGGGGW